MQDQEYHGGFSKKQQEKYEQEIKVKYGDKALEESKRRMKGWTKADYQKVQEEGDKIFTAIRDNICKGAKSPEVQAQIKNLAGWINHFYSCNNEMLLGLGHLYGEHPDFVKMFKTKYHDNMPDFLFQAIQIYCEKEGKKAK
jgi:hypothetical protein